VKAACFSRMRAEATPASTGENAGERISPRTTCVGEPPLAISGR